MRESSTSLVKVKALPRGLSRLLYFAEEGDVVLAKPKQLLSEETFHGGGMADVRQFEIEIQRDWVLITYDIPAKMDATRKRVIRALRNMGALKHTDSVYYLPASKKAIQLAETLPGEVYVWRSSLTSDTQAKRLTQEYYNKIIEGINKLHGRIDSLEQNFPILSVEAKKQRLNYSIALFNSLKAAANNIGMLVYERLADVGQRLDVLKEQSWGAT